MSQHRQVFYLTFEVFVIKRSPSQSSAIDECCWLLPACLLAKQNEEKKRTQHTHARRHLHVLNETETNTQINVFFFYVVTDACQLCVQCRLLDHGCAKWMMLNMHVHFGWLQIYRC